MKRKRMFRYLLATLVIILLAWLTLTLWVERTGPAKSRTLGPGLAKKAIIIYDPDPFHNLDEKISTSFAKALTENNITVQIATVAAADHLGTQQYDLYVYCANTWMPDWAVTSYIRDHQDQVRDKPVIAITLGAGSTNSSKQYFEECIRTNGGILLDSYTLLLLRPNGETKVKRPNIEVAEELAYAWGQQIADRINAD